MRVPAFTRSFARLSAALFLAFSLYLSSEHAAEESVHLGGKSAAEPPQPPASSDVYPGLSARIADLAQARHPEVAAIYRRAVAQGRNIELPRIQKSVSPQYPVYQWMAHQTAVVWIEFVVDVNGEPMELGSITDGASSSDRDLVAAAKTAVRQWRFSPLRIDGNPAPCVEVLPLVFTFESGPTRSKEAYDRRVKQTWKDGQELLNITKRLESKFTRELQPAMAAFVQGRLGPPHLVKGESRVLDPFDPKPDCAKIYAGILVDSGGNVQVVEFSPAAPVSPDDSRVTAARKLVVDWRFSPAMVDGKPVTCSVAIVLLTDGSTIFSDVALK